MHMKLASFLFLKSSVCCLLALTLLACTQKLKIEDQQVGTGPAVKHKDIVRVHYSGWLEKNGTIFDDSRQRDRPYVFVVGAGRVIEGWDQGILGMKKGGKRRITIPPEMAYGPQKKRGIPPNSTLVFDIELLEIIDANALIKPKKEAGKPAPDKKNQEMNNSHSHQH